MIDLTQDSYDRAINGGSPVLVAFMDDSVLASKALASVLDELAADYEGKVVFARVDAAGAPQIASDKNVQTVPAVVLYQGGQEVRRLVGMLTKDQVADALNGL